MDLEFNNSNEGDSPIPCWIQETFTRMYQYVTMVLDRSGSGHRNIHSLAHNTQNLENGANSGHTVHFISSIVSRLEEQFCFLYCFLGP